MPDLEEMENRFFTEGPRFCVQGFFALLGAGLALSALGAAFSDEGTWVDHFGFAGLLAVPAVLLLLLSFALKRRHVVTIPLVLAICAFVARYFIVSPDAELEGMEVSILHRAVAWASIAAMGLGICVAVWFMWHLWKKGAFK
jgi:hypothetical protein